MFYIRVFVSKRVLVKVFFRPKDRNEERCSGSGRMLVRMKSMRSVVDVPFSWVDLFFPNSISLGFRFFDMIELVSCVVGLGLVSFSIPSLRLFPILCQENTRPKDQMSDKPLAAAFCPCATESRDCWRQREVTRKEAKEE